MDTISQKQISKYQASREAASQKSRSSQQRVITGSNKHETVNYQQNELVRQTIGKNQRIKLEVSPWLINLDLGNRSEFGSELRRGVEERAPGRVR